MATALVRPDTRTAMGRGGWWSRRRAGRAVAPPATGGAVAEQRAGVATPRGHRQGIGHGLDAHGQGGVREGPVAELAEPVAPPAADHAIGQELTRVTITGGETHKCVPWPGLRRDGHTRGRVRVKTDGGRQGDHGEQGDHATVSSWSPSSHCRRGGSPHISGSNGLSRPRGARALLGLADFATRFRARRLCLSSLD